MTKRTILIVEDNAMNRDMLRRMLCSDYEVLEAGDGDSALALLHSAHEHICAILLDLIMPRLDGYGVLRQLRADERLRQIPVIVITGASGDDAESKALSLGAVDFITKPYVPSLVRLRLSNLIRLQEAAALVSATQLDKLTGLYSRDEFIRTAGDMIAAHEEGYYILACLDVDSFKVINDQYGSGKGDEVLKFIAQVLQEGLGPVGGIGCRIEADNFAALYPRHILSSGKVDDIRAQAALRNGSIPPFTVSTGRYAVVDKSLSVSAMYDRALLAKRTIKGRFDTHTALYDESMRERLLHEQEITGSMNAALQQGQFEVWFQPQYNHSTGARIGAEALVRWRHPQKGMISPSSFVPVFERNGFIYELDKYIWEQTCMLLRKWLDQGRSPLPVSVNISRYDVFRDDLLDNIIGLIKKYRLPVELLRLEVTESAFAGSTEHIVNVVKQLIDYGFTVEIDDFGSAYSSLNTLKDVPAQILKLDMRFLEGNDDSGRGGNVLESIVRMARWLGMSVIAEGVEEQEQADYLESIGCNYVQGYLYAQPMPCAEYEALALSTDQEEKMIALETVETLDNSAFWNPKSLDTLIFNSLVGGACIFEYANGRAELLRANQKYSRVVGGDELTLAEALRIDLHQTLEPASLDAARAACQRAIETNEESTCEVILQNVTKKRPRIYLRLTLRVIARAGGRYLFYCINEDLTEQREAERNEHLIYEQMLTITHNMNGAVTATVFDDEGAHFLFTNDQYYALMGYTRAQYEAEVSDVFDCIHPDDRENVARQVRQANQTGEAYTVEYRVLRRDHSIMWFHSNISMIHFPGREQLVQLAVANDVTAERQVEQERRRLSVQMQEIMDNVGSGITAAVTKGGEVSFLFANNRYYEIFGYTREQYTQEVSDSFALIHPDDRQMVIAATETANRTGESATLEYRAKRRDSTWIWLRAVLSITSFDQVEGPVELCIFSDISKEKAAALQLAESAEQLRFLNESAHALLAQIDVDSGIDDILRRILNYFDGNRAYIIENDYTQETADNTYEACAAGVTSEQANLHAIPFAAMQFWFRAFGQGSFISIPDIDALDDSRAEERRILQEQGIHSIVAVPLLRENQLIGLVGVDDPRRQLSHISHLQAIGAYITVMLNRRDLNAKITADSKNLRDMMNDTPGGFVRLRVGEHGALATEYVNETFCRLRGLSREDILAADNEDATGTIYPADVQAVQAAVADMISTGQTQNMKYRLLRADGTYVPVSVFGRMSQDDLGNRYINAYYADMTEQERRDLAVRETLPSVLSAIFSSTSDVAFAKDKAFRYICCSAALAQLAGLDTAADVIGKTDYDIFPPAIADRFRQHDQALRETGRPAVDYVEEIFAADGAPHYISMSKYPLHDTFGNIIGVYGAGRDITEERDAYARLKLLTNSIPGGIATYIYSAGTISVTYYNDTFCRMLGYTREEYDAISAGSAVSMVFKEDLPVIMQHLEQLLSAGTPIDCRYRIHQKDGGYIWVNLKGELFERHGDVAVINTVLYDITDRVAAENNLRMSEEWFRAAAQLGGREIARYDVKTGVYHHDNQTLLQLGFGHEVKHVPQAFIDCKFIAPECVGDYLDFFAKIKRGEKKCTVDNALLTLDGTYAWMRAEATVIFDEDGRPSQAIIAAENISEQREQAAALQKLQQSLHNRPSDSYTFFRWNLSRDMLVLSAEGTLVKPGASSGRASFNELAEAYCRRCIWAADRQAYLALANSQTLIENFRQGRRAETLDYREALPHGAAWRRLSIELVEYPNSSDIEAYVTIEDIDEQKRNELHTLALAETDPLTGVLNRTTFAERMNNVIRENSAQHHALFMLDVDGFKHINDSLGHAAGDQTLINVARTLSAALRRGDLVGRLGGDEFVVFLSNVTPPAAIAGKARQLCDLLHQAGGPELRTSISLGVALYPDDGSDFDALYHCADIALYRVKDAGKDNFAFYDPQMC